MRVSSLGPWLLSLLLLTTGPALADNTADEADIAFELGNDAYSRGSYTEALRSYFTSYRLVPNRNVLFNIARCFEALGKFNEAYRYYNDLLGEDLPTEDASEVTRSLERLRPKVALVRVTTNPRGADVFVDRTDLGSRGRSPQTLALAPGRHKVLVRKDGFRPTEATVTVTKGRETPVDLDLGLITGIVDITGTPEGAELRDNPTGPILGRIPAKLRLSPGQRVLHVRAPGHAPGQYVIDVPAEGTLPLVVTLSAQTRPTGRVVVTANHDGAAVRVDGRPAGFTPTVVTLPEGEHVLEVESRDVRPMRQKVTVIPDKEVKVHATLRYEPPPVRAASKSLLSVDEAPASTTVLTPEELRAFGWRTLAEALAGVRGFFLTDDRTYTYLGVRGFSPPGDLNTRILILWDGHAMNDVWAGQGYAAHDLSVDLEEVERIEVVRGPGSALYGTGAFFGVINVVPRESLGLDRRLEITGSVGALGSTLVHATTSWEDPDRSVLFSLAGMKSRGADTTLLGNPGPIVTGLDGEKAGTGSVRARIGNLSLVAQLHGRTKDVPTAPYGTQVGAQGTRVQDVRGFAEAKYERDLSQRIALSLRGAADLSRYRGYFNYGGDVAQTNTDSGAADWLTAEARLLVGLFDSHRLTFGVEGQHQLRVDQKSVGPSVDDPLGTRKRSLVSVYALDEWRLHPRLSLSLGFRVDKYTDLDSLPLTPRLAVIGRPYDKGLTKLVIGRAFRAPNVYELFYQDNLLTQRPAEQLEPETITTFEVEHSHDLTQELRVTVAGYHNRISQLITLTTESAPTPGCGPEGAPSQCLVYANSSGETMAWGAEAGLHWQPGRWLLVDLSYSYVTLRNASQDVVQAKPAHLASGRFLLPVGNGDMRIATQATYQSSRVDGISGADSGEALLVGFGVSGDYGRLRYFAGVNNLLDSRYAFIVGEDASAGPVPQYGRTFNLQLTGSF
ncbi:TonB-dependent receptor [Corallococcus sp. CA047B]|uniref:TonB-dependent receptor domain-containing protein n=1 Tax=Corallococcus sp. CA047B TaxID=2316729 RepID=UPI000EA2DF5D|nr:TonB-dependent receptor [Corallococcus sp. CA047B]RKH10860.1 TonB-dependent receptor [Corallococcus sp. CA047B]